MGARTGNASQGQMMSEGLARWRALFLIASVVSVPAFGFEVDGSRSGMLREDVLAELKRRDFSPIEMQEDDILGSGAGGETKSLLLGMSFC